MKTKSIIRFPMKTKDDFVIAIYKVLTAIIIAASVYATIQMFNS